MPMHESWKSLYTAMIKEYGAEKGKDVFYAYLNKHGYDETKPRPKGKSKSVDTFYTAFQPYNVNTKQFYGATVPIINVKSVEVEGEENFFVEGFLSAPIQDIHGETLDLPVLDEWSRECVVAPHNLMWLDHDSPYKKPENIAKPAILKITESRVGEITDPHGNKHKGLWVKAVFNKLHPRFSEIWTSVKNGFINSFSVEFVPLVIDPIRKVVQKAKYLASCLVMAPANDLATITSAYAKSFQGANIMSQQTQDPNQQTQPPATQQPPAPEPTPNVPPQIPIPTQSPDDLETLLQQRDQMRALLIGPQIPGYPQPNIQPVAGTQPVPQQAPQAPQPQAPQAPAPQPSAVDTKLDQILSQLNNFDNRLKIVEQVVPQPDPDPTPQEVAKVLKYLAGKGEDLFSIPQQPPTQEPQSKGASGNESASASVSPPQSGNDTVDPEGVSFKSFTIEEVEQIVLDAMKSGQVVRKAISEAVPSASNADFDLSSQNHEDEHSLESLLRKNDRIYASVEHNRIIQPI